MNEEAKNSAAESMRARPSPEFVNGEWVKVQFGPCAPKRQKHIAGRLAERYPHWTGDEDDSGFCRKIAADLALPGFLGDIFDASRGEGGKKPGKPPFHFMLRRIFLNVKESGGRRATFKDAGVCKSALRAALREKRLEDARDFAFFSAIWLDVPGEVAAIVAGSPVAEELRDFLRDFAEKSAEKDAAMRVVALESSRADWKKMLSEGAADMHSRADEEPNAAAAEVVRELARRLERAAEKYAQLREDEKTDEDAADDTTGGALRGIIGKLSPFADEKNVSLLREHLARLADEESPAPDSPAMKKLSDDIDGVAELLERRAALSADMRREADAGDSAAAELCAQQMKILEKEIDSTVARLLPRAKDTKKVAPPAADSESSAPPPAANAPPVADAVSPPPPAEEPAPSVAAAEESEAESEERRYAEWINALVQKLILAEVFDVAYHIARCGEMRAPDKMVFPSAALHLLAFPEQAGEGARGGALEECLHGDGVGEARKVAAFAAALFPAVFHLSSGARAIYRDYGPLSDCGGADGLDAVRAGVHAFENWTVNAADFSAAAQGAAPRDVAAERKRELAAWYEANKTKTLKFAPATHAWGKWMKEGGFLGGVICPLLADHSSKSARAKLVRARTAAEEFLRDYGGAADAAIGKIPGKKIEGGAKIHLRNLFEECVSLLQKTADAMRDGEKKPQRVDVLDDKCRAFRQSLDNLDLSETPGEGDDFMRAARCCLRRAAGFFAPEEMESILAGGRRDRAPGLARVSGARHDFAGRPFKYSDRIAKLAEDALKEEWFKEESAAACRRQIDADAMLSARLLLPETGEDESGRLRAQIDGRIEKLRRELAERIAGLHKKLNGAQMPHGEKERLREQMMRVEPKSLPADARREGEVIVDFPQARDIISRVEREVDDKLRELRGRVEKERMSDERRELARRALRDGDAIFAEYLVETDDSEEVLQKIRRRSSPHIRRFFDGEYIDKALSAPLEKTFAAAAGAGGMSAQTRKRRESLLKKWEAMFSGDADEESRRIAVREFLAEIGFSILGAQSAPGGARVSSVAIATNPWRSSPSADFGSRADGKYVVAPAPAGTTIAEMLDAADAARGGGARFVFYDGVLRDEDREEFRRANEESARREKAALFDRASLLYLCLLPERENMQGAFFDLSLPFSGINPFVAGRGDVPVEMFYGRKKEINAVAGEGSFLVYGGRMLGKTALLHHVRKERHRPERGRYAFVADLKEGDNHARLLKNPSFVWDVIWDKLSAEAGAKSSKRGADKKLEEWLDGDGDRSLLAMLDEADYFLERDTADNSPNLVRFKNLTDKYGGRFKAIFAGLHNVKRSTRRANAAIARYGGPICVGPFEGAEQAEAVRLIEEPFAAAGFVFEDGALPLEAANRANFYPSLIQYLCRYWLEELRAIPGALRVITAKHVRAAFVEKDLRGRLADVFDGTLNLDKRYALIAFVVALATLQAREESRVVQGEDAGAIRRACLDWWKESVQDLTSNEFQCLLEELADLGALRRDENSGKWLLRSDLVLSLMGSRGEIEDKILNLTSEDFRSPSNSGDSYRRKSADGYSPLTLHQESQVLDDLGGGRRHCRAILGGPAAGMDSVPAALRSLAEERNWLYDGGAGANGIGGLKRDLAAFEKRIRGEKKEGGIWRVEDAPWSREWIEAVAEGSSSSKYKTVVVFLGDGGFARSLPEGMRPIYLGPDGGAFLDGELRDGFSGGEVAEIKNISGGFVAAVNDLLAAGGAARIPKWRDAVAARGDSPAFWGLPAEWGDSFFKLAWAVADESGGFSESDIEYGMQELVAGRGAFAGWTPSAIVELLCDLSLSSPAEKGDNKGGACRLIAPLHRAVARVCGGTRVSSSTVRAEDS